MRLLLALLACTAFADDFPKPFNTGNDVGRKPMPASEAVKLIEMPPGFKATVFASEPDVQNPIACAWDSRGRLWVAENYTYAEAKTNFDKTLRDRILIFEDTDGDGVADKRTVFCENLQNLTSIELGYGGVFATAAPRLVFIPMKDGEDKPAGEPETLLDGFDAWSVRHNIVNGLKWGPDGWLYGRHGIMATSHVGVPGTPDEARVALNCCIWRYHPVNKKFEVVTWGGTNSWGLDWNEVGEGFFINTVIGQLYHLIPGAHYERMYGQDLNPYIYQLLPQTADHYHFDTSKSWTDSRDGKANDLGGGHAHSGCMIYGGENWPVEYRGKLFTINLHGRRINCERLERQGSGYVAKHDSDPIKFGDPWFRGVEISEGPDGGVYVLDWSDDGECHESDGVHRESGRIYKIKYEKSDDPAESEKWGIKMSPWEVIQKKGGFSALSDQELITAAFVGSKWVGSMAARLVAAKASLTEARIEKVWIELSGAFPKRPYGSTQLGYMVLETQYLYRDILIGRIRKILHPPSPQEIKKGDQYRKKTLGERSVTESYAQQRLEDLEWVAAQPLASRASLMAKLLAAETDNADRNLPLMYWSTLEPIFRSANDSTVNEASAVALTGKISLLHEFTARRVTEDLVAHPARLAKVLALATTKFEEQKAASVLRGIAAAARGQAKAVKPASWDAFAAKAGQVPALADSLRQLNVLFGDGRALGEIRQIALDGKAEFAARKQALDSLVAAGPADLRATLDALVKDNELLPHTLVALAKFDDAGAVIVANYGRVRAEGRPGVLAALCSRPAFARALLDAVAAGKIARADVTPYHARQIAALGDGGVSQRLAEVWGTVGSSSEQKKARMAELKRELSPEFRKGADVAKGRAIFTQTCAACHTLYDLGQQGTNLGPNLTGSGRENLDYPLENIVDPSAVVPADYKLSTVTLKDGRVLSGFIAAQNDQTLTVRTMTETQTVPRGDVAKTEASAQSLMPEGLLDTLTPEQRRDLVGFLMRK